MKIISWNINGIRAVVTHGFKDFLISQKPDILCLQEIKISDATKLITEFDFVGYREYFNCAKRPGYSGTAILVRDDLLKNNWPLKNGIGITKFDDEGRVQTLELDKFYLINIYFPNSNHELSRLGYKLEFNEALLKYFKKLEQKKPLIITGDYNVAHQEIDLARPYDNEGSAGFTQEERTWMTKFLQAGYLDTYRELNGQKIQYTWWTYRTAARARNIGWRIDYFCVSAKLKKHLKKVYIQDKIMGSDHAPIGLEIYE